MIRMVAVVRSAFSGAVPALPSGWVICPRLTADGLLPDPVMALLQTPGGAVLSGSGVGLTEFPGLEFRTALWLMLPVVASATAAWWYLNRKHRGQVASLEKERLIQAEVSHLSRVSTLAQLSGSLAHELNQPLGIILSNAQAALRMLGQANPDLEEIRAILTDIVEEDLRAGELIKRLRALIKGGETLLVPVSPNDLVRSVLRIFRGGLADRGVTVETALAPGLPDIPGDEVQLQQVLLNLMANGCDAMAGLPPGERVLKIATSLEPDGVVRIRVEDRGQGIPEGDGSRIFQPFFTTKDQGMGLGLSICRTIIAAHHGHIRSVSPPGTGAAFQIDLKTDFPAHYA